MDYPLQTNKTNNKYTHIAGRQAIDFAISDLYKRYLLTPNCY